MVLWVYSKGGVNMNQLFSKSSLQILESLSFTNTLYAFDYDGTLSPIVANPDQAEMPSETFELLSRLSSKVTTAVLSGRSLADLKPRIPANVKYLIGNHGLEGLPRTTPVSTLHSQSQAWKIALEKQLNPIADELGISIEDKEYSLAIHYRRSRKRKLARQATQAAIASLEGNPKVIFGKLVFNVVPHEGPHKGVALTRLMAESGAGFAFYIGDDMTDEDVFGLNDSRILTVRVGNRRCSQAKYCINRQSEINLLLKQILHFHSATG